MKNQKHTPGPWHVIANGCSMPGGTIASAVAKGHTLSGSRFIAFTEGQDRAANARLIAAAPALLDECKKLRDVLGMAFNSGADPEPVAQVMQSSRAAIAQAEGKEQL